MFERYMPDCRESGVTRRQVVIHPAATLQADYLASSFLMGSPEPFHDTVRSARAPTAALQV